MKDATDITVVLDRSGSMITIKDDTIGGLNQFVEDQKKIPGECRMTLIQFDSQNPQYVVFEGLPIADVYGVTLVPRANTPLYDAVGQAIVRTGERLSRMGESDRPDKVLFVIVTDGYENASREYTQKQVFDMVKEQTNTYKWQFVYLGANQDAMAVGRQLGVKMGSTMSYAANSIGTRSTYEALSLAGGAHRRGQRVEFTDKQRKAALGDRNTDVDAPKARKAQ